MKNIIAVCLSCLVLLGCSRTRSSPEKNLTFENGTTVHAQHRNGDALEGVHLVTEANGEKWTYEAKTGTISKGVDGMVQIVLFDVQADLGSKGLMHEDRMTMAFRKKDSNENLNTTVTTDLPKFTISASDLAVPAEVVTNSTPSSNQLTVSINLQFSNAKAEEFQKFTREHLN